jgi:guanidinoacetate N-methyltransferase
MSGNFAAHLFEPMANHLDESGRLVYFTNEINTISREHQRILLKFYSRLEMQVLKGLKPPETCQYWWANSMVVIGAVK